MRMQFIIDLILKISSLLYHKIGFNLVEMIEYLLVKRPSVKHIVSSLFIWNLIHRTSVMHFSFDDVDESRNIRLNFIERMHLDTRFYTVKFCQPEDVQAKINDSRVEGKHLPFYLKVIVNSLLS